MTSCGVNCLPVQPFPPESQPHAGDAQPSSALPGELAQLHELRATWRPGRVPHVAALLQARVHHLAGPRPDAVVGWGRKASGLRAVAQARDLGVPWLLLEDAFLRSIDLGFRDAALGVVVDDVGIYYDATGPSRLERLIAAPKTAEQFGRARRLATAWCDGRVSKYNLAREVAPPVAPGYVLVIDQTAGDSSIATGLASAASFRHMLEAALDEHPGAPVLLKVHPDVVSGRKQGHFAEMTRGMHQRVTVLAEDAHTPGLLEPARAVYVVTSQVGFEALLWNRPVRVFGMPFYAGWGLTQDALPAPDRRKPVSLEALVHAALVDYARYVDPETLAPCQVETLLAWMALQRRMRERFAPAVRAIGFRGWKRPIARAYFGGSRLHFSEGRAAEAPCSAGEDVAVWGLAPAPAAVPPQHLVRVEDGFLRSVGLGADLVRPLSWVQDRRGMYYDPSQPSELEHLLATTVFDDALLARARALRERLVTAGLTKYNVGAGAWQPPAGRRVVLVPGQVESDASILRGAGRVRRNLDLLRAAREAEPGAWLIYKPHPDVLAGLRAGADEARASHDGCDEWVTDVPMHRLLERIDVLHTMTSLAGFEALLRGVRVVCHGQPFYAGWGLTEDTEAHPRRQRRLSLDELVAATLILYPTYVSRRSGHFTTPERAIDELLAWREDPNAGRRRWPAWLRPLVSRWLGWRGR